MREKRKRTEQPPAKPAHDAGINAPKPKDAQHNAPSCAAPIGASSHVVASTDFGEELDDLLAYVYGFVQLPGTKHLIVSGPDPEERLAELRKFTNKPHAFNDPQDGVIFYRDSDAASLAALPQQACAAFINNGPLSKAGLDAVTTALRPRALLYLVGSSDQGTTGGINQNYGDDCWQSFIEQFCKADIVDLTAGITRKVRFPNTAVVFPRGSHIYRVASRSVFMFFASRPCIPPRFAGMATHIRLNAANAQICEYWRAEAQLPAHEAAHELAATQAHEYVTALREMHGAGGGKGDSVLTVTQQFALAGLQTTDLLSAPKGGVALNEAHWSKVEALSRRCFEFTFDLGAMIQQEQGGAFPLLYVQGKFGFEPRNKMSPNPDDAFVSSEVVDQYCDKAMEQLETVTPAYDLLSALLVKHANEIPLSEEKVEDYQRMVVAAML